MKQNKRRSKVAKGAGCFYCQHECNGHVDVNVPGWQYDCKLGIDNTNIEHLSDVLKCQSHSVRYGFQMGGYYTHMRIEGGGGIEDCKQWVIWGDGEFPSDEKPPMDIHICDLHQIKEFIDFWIAYYEGKTPEEIIAIVGDK